MTSAWEVSFSKAPGQNRLGEGVETAGPDQKPEGC